MKAVLALFAVLAVSCNAALDCQNVPQYTEGLQLACMGEEIYVLWPNYSNFSQYYRCRGQGNPVLVTCPAATPYFSYVLQSCQNCDNFIPAQPCNTLNFGFYSKCVPIGGSTTPTTPSTAAPGTTPTIPSTAAPGTTPTTPITAAPGTTPTIPSTAAPGTTPTTPITAAPGTTPTIPSTAAPGTTPTTTDIPPPPSPTTQNSLVPSPPIAPPTPPTLENTPPSYPNPNNA